MFLSHIVFVWLGPTTSEVPVSLGGVNQLNAATSRMVSEMLLGYQHYASLKSRAYDKTPLPSSYIQNRWGADYRARLVDISGAGERKAIPVNLIGIAEKRTGHICQCNLLPSCLTSSNYVWKVGIEIIRFILMCLERKQCRSNYGDIGNLSEEFIDKITVPNMSVSIVEGHIIASHMHDHEVGLLGDGSICMDGQLGDSITSVTFAIIYYQVILDSSLWPTIRDSTLRRWNTSFSHHCLHRILQGLKPHVVWGNQTTMYILSSIVPVWTEPII